MKNYIYTACFLLILFSCSEKKSTDDTKETVDKQTIPFTEMVERHIEANLEIPSQEKYSYNIYKEHLDNDTIIDAIITVNRLEFALEEARKSGNSAKRAEIGFTGRYNYIFYFDGSLNKISPAVPVPSSPHAKLSVDFVNLFNKNHKDLIIDYTIMNARYRNYFAIFNHTPKQIFQWKLYENLGEDTEMANYIEYEEGSYSKVKDILIYEGKLENSENIENIYEFEPIYKKTGALKHRFFFLEKERKYFTKK